MITFDTTERKIKRAPCDYIPVINNSSSYSSDLQKLIKVRDMQYVKMREKKSMALCALLTIVCHRPTEEKSKDYS